MELLPIIPAVIAEAIVLYMVTKCRCVLAPDIHKVNQPLIPKIGGIGLLAALPLSLIHISEPTRPY